MMRYVKAGKGLYRFLRKVMDPFCFWIVLAAILLSPFEYWAIISIPDSTDYFLQSVDSAVQGPDGREFIFVGDDLHISAYNWRHLINGTCFIPVDRVRENVGGKFDGRVHLMQHVDQQFVGDGVIRKTHWPVAPQVIPITSDWIDDPTADEQTVDIYTTGWFDCNPLDKIRIWIGLPRLHHNSKLEPERERTRVVIRRRKFDATGHLNVN